jgi:hypothetical protein
MSRNTARWAPSAVTHKSKNTRQSQPDSSDDDDSFDESRSTGRPKSRYRVREAKPDDSKYKGPYSNYPDSPELSGCDCRVFFDLWVTAEGAHLAVFLDIGRGGTLVESNCSLDELGIASESSCFSPLEDEIPDVLV